MAVIGYKYFFGIHMGISRGPVDELVEVKVGDKTAWRGSVTNSGDVAISQPSLFGGDSKEGGIDGTLTVMMGENTQTAPSVMTSIFGALPGFRRMFTMYFDGQISANNPYPKKWSFRHRRILKGWDGDPWYPEKATINLIRSVGPGEAELGTGTNATIEVSEIVTAAPGQTVTLNLNGGTGTVTLINSVYGYEVINLGHDNGSISNNIYLTQGTDWTLSGNDITFDAGISSNFLYITVNYRANVTIDGAGVGGIGDTLIKAANPAHVIYECLTNREWGRGLPRAKLNDAAFRSAADLLFSEAFGFCQRWRRRDEIQVFVQSVLDHIGGVLYEDRTTGLLTLRLIRDDYVQGALPLFTTDTGLLSINEASVSAITKMVNQVRVTYRDPVTNNDKVVRVSNLAALQASGGSINVVSKEFPGAPTAEIASRIAKRELRSLSPSIRRFNLTFDRRASSLYPGGVVRIRDLQRNIPDMVLRIATIDYGTLRDGRIKVTAVQDVFGTPRRGVVTIGPNTWVPPSNQACVGQYGLYEVPYRSIYRSLSTADFAFVDNESAFVGVLLERGQPLNVSTDIAVKTGTVDISELPPNGDYYCGYTP